ncbi:uncharacterized protein DDB_G0280579-like isoform X3 [Scylla paramamosain]|uniref:uncharacterized protein DDB_G0280579-like isoform X3 n=1 Tax=Scylla paramamosain TaxID=85552 RepID=UPI00308399AF
MDTPATLDVDYDEEHHSEGAAQLEALEDQLSLHSSTSGEEHVLPDAGGSPDGIFWGSFALTIGDFLRRCCSKLTGASTHDPVLLNVTGRQSKDDLDKDGAEDDKRSEGSSSDEGEGGSNKKLENSTTTKVTFHKSEGDGDGTEPSEGKGKEAAKERDATDDAAEEAEGQQGDAKTTEAAEESEAAAAGENRENEETKEVEAKEAQESEKRSRRSSSSSSSSSSDEESSVRQRKNAAAETAPEGEAAAAAGEVEHKE